MLIDIRTDKCVEVLTESELENEYTLITPKIESFKPKDGDGYFTPNLSNSSLYEKYTWAGDTVDLRLQSQGLIYKTADDAIAISKILLEKLKEIK